MLNRKSLEDGTFLNAFKNVPGLDWWPEERIESSMQSMLASRPPQEPIWVFAYGSLIWNPLFQFAESCPATLPGWRRSFCIHLFVGRACSTRPGRMMALAAGGLTEGLALRLSEDCVEEELRVIWRREMVGGAYRPTWTRVTLSDGRSVRALTFTAETQSKLYQAQDDIDTIAPLIAAAEGPLGPNRDYVLQLYSALRQHGIEDAYIQQLAECVRSGD